MKKVIITGDDVEGLIIEAKGYTDGTCRQATAPYEELFEVGERTIKSPACLAEEARAVESEKTRVGS